MALTLNQDHRDMRKNTCLCLFFCSFQVVLMKFDLLLQYFDWIKLKPILFCRINTQGKQHCSDSVTNLCNALFI